MALLGDDGRGYELARMLESHGVWRPWLGDSLYSNFIHFLSSPSSWDAFMSADFGSSGAGVITDYFRTRAQLQLQLRVRALLFDKASISLYLRSNTVSSNSISKLNPNYLQLHGDDVYFTLEEAAQMRDSACAGSSRASSKVQSRSSFNVGSRYTESDVLPQKFKFDEFPETWYAQFFETYRTSKSYRLSFGDYETEKRTPEQMSTYLGVAEKHKRKRAAFREEQGIGAFSSTLHNGANMLSTSFVNDNHSSDEDVLFFPETMFSMNSVPDGVVMPRSRVQYCGKVEFNGVLDNLPQVVTRSPIMIERLGIKPECLGFNQGGNQCPGRSGSEVNRIFIGEEQASALSQKLIARYLYKLGFEGSSEVPLQVLAQLLSSHICKLGRTLRLLADSFKRQCSSMELLKMFLHTAGYSNLGALAELVKMTKGTVQHTQQNTQLGQLHLQVPRQTQQIPRQMIPQIQQMLSSQNLTVQQQQLLWERVRKRQQPAPAPRTGMIMDKDRPLVQVKVENPSELPVDNNFNAVNSSHPQMQQFRQQQQQQQAAAMSLHAQNSNQFRPMSCLPIPQSPSPSMGSVTRAPPVKVEGFQDLIGGGDSSLKHNSEENKLTSPSK